MNRRFQRRTITRLFGWLALAGCVYGIYYTYRWAEPSRDALNSVMTRPASSNLALSMENVAFDNYTNGYKNWSVKAGRIDVERPPAGMAISTLQRAVINGIHEGKLYALPEGDLPLNATSASGEAPAGPPTATFSAQNGRYVAGLLDPVPNDLQLLYNVQWQFKLTGDVHLQTRDGIRMTAPALTILELAHSHTGKLERRMLCDQGVDVAVKSVKLHANSVRFDPASRVLECTGGVRATIRSNKDTNTVQADSAFWSLKDNVIRCPETATGLWNGTAFTAQNLSVDTKKQDFQGSSGELQLQSIAGGNLPLP